jgi:hypothetical protein
MTLILLITSLFLWAKDDSLIKNKVWNFYGESFSDYFYPFWRLGCAPFCAYLKDIWDVKIEDI